MKKYSYIIGIFAMLSFAACEILDRDVIIDQTDEFALKLFNQSEARLTGVYANLQSGYHYIQDPTGQINGAMLAAASDEAEHTLETSPVQLFNNGTWNPINNPDHAWNIYYTGIRRANHFLENCDTLSINLDQWRYDLPNIQGYYTRVAQIKRWRGEAKFLRAFFYFELIKRYGGIPIITRTLNLEDNFAEINRSSLQDCLDFIISEVDTIVQYNYLPDVYSDNSEIGRATKGAALALKSRALLYAASDLYNDASWAGGYANPQLISLTGDRNAKWEAAANAAKAVIELNRYSLSSNFRNYFLADGFTSNETIFNRRAGGTNSIEQANFPIGYDLGRSGTTPSQNLVDAFEMNDGSKFDWNNPSHAADPFSNRDPRLGLTVRLNNTVLRGRPVEAFVGGRDGRGTPRATKTGHYLRKHVDDNINPVIGQTAVRSWAFFRYAEILLNYVEALNEYSPGHPDIVNYLNMIRQRPGINMPPVTPGSQNEMRTKIRNERRVELAFEDHRVWDVRRWMIAPQTLGSPLEGLEIQKVGDNQFTYQKIQVENRVFEPKMYWYPIPMVEIQLSQNWPQNPLW